MIQTETLALWGAVTGTIGTFAGLLGLWLRFKQYGLDKAELLSESSFGYDSPIHPKHKITIRSVGRRPVIVDYVRYFITPKKWHHRITKKFQHKKGRWIWDQEPKSKVKVDEGEKAEIAIFLPNGIEITEIYKVNLIDQAGKSWPVKWPNTQTLKKTATKSELDTISDENDKRTVRATGYRLGERYFLETKFNTKPIRMNIASGRSFWFLDEKKYKEKLIELRDIQFSKFLRAEIEELA